MGWTLANKPKTEKVTKAMAKKFAEMEPAPHDRPLSERRLQVYGKMLAEGSFRPVTWAIAHCLETNGEYRVNGKHTSTMLSGLDKMPDFYVTVEEYDCDTLEDVARLYATFDSSMQSRSAKDIYLSFAGTVAELAGVTDKAIVACVAGIAYAQAGQDVGRQTTPASRAEQLLEYPEFVIWLNKLLADAPTRRASGISNSSKQKAIHLYRSPVVAAMFLMWQRSKTAATEFWMECRDESGVKPDMPSRKLAKWLITSTLSKKEHTRVRKAGDRETYVKCIHAWNAWRNKESTNLTYYSDAKVPAIK